MEVTVASLAGLVELPFDEEAGRGAVFEAEPIGFIGG
jgi:hypothetical protein